MSDFVHRWRRRAVTIPAMLGATVVAVVGFPLLAPAAVAYDLVRLRRRLPTLRVYLFALQYLVNDSVEIVAMPLLWVRAGFGTRIGSEASIARHEALQWWSVRLLVDRAARLLGLRVRVDEASAEALTPGPVIVLCRHVSLFDASLAGLLYQERSMRVRGVVMAELLADPGFDLLYGRLGSVFIPRDDGPRALAAVRTMTDGAGPDTAYVIYPEGRLYRPDVRDRLLDRLRSSDPDRAARLASIRRLLPPRPGGVLALLDAVPEADVVVVDHRGLDRWPSVGALVDQVPVDTTVAVTARRIDRAAIPTGRDERVAWLDELWLDLDRALVADLGPGAPVDALGPDRQP